MKNNIKAEIIAHSKRESTGEEIITYKLTFPRIILSEVNTYKMIEKNTSSCLDGNTSITLYNPDSKKFFDKYIRDIFYDFINDSVDYKIVSYVESGEKEGCFIIQDIKTVFSSGVKEIYSLEQNNIYAPIKLTKEHRLLTNNGWKTLQDYYLPEKDTFKVTDSILAMNTNIPFFDIKRGSDNIIYTKSSEDAYIILDTLSSIRVKPRGKAETYDIEVDGEYHNFIANGVVVHNSRAIPFEKMVEVVENDPFIPLAWQKHHKGMQGAEYITDPKQIQFKIDTWLEARDKAIEYARKLYEDATFVCAEGNRKWWETYDGTSKQITNRILEPWMWVCQLVTGARESFEHLFEQRCPQYEFEDGEMRLINGTIIPGKLTGKSKKEVLITATLNSGSPRIIEDGLSELEWLQHNKGQAEIHFMDLAEKMYDALHESKPQILKENQWHIPFDSEITQQFQTLDIPLEDMIKMSVAKTARISYTTIEGTKDLTLEQAEKIYEKCKQNGHYSVFSHIAKCMDKDEYESWIKGQVKMVSFSEFEDETFLEMPSNEVKGWNKNLKGFLSYRQNIENELNKLM